MVGKSFPVSARLLKAAANRTIMAATQMRATLTLPLRPAPANSRLQPSLHVQQRHVVLAQNPFDVVFVVGEQAFELRLPLALAVAHAHRDLVVELHWWFGRQWDQD